MKMTMAAALLVFVVPAAAQERGGTSAWEQELALAAEGPVYVLGGWQADGEAAECFGRSERAIETIKGELRRAGATVSPQVPGSASFFWLWVVAGRLDVNTCVIAWRLQWVGERTYWEPGMRLQWGPRATAGRELRAVIREQVAELGDEIARGRARLVEEPPGECLSPGDAR